MVSEGHIGGQFRLEENPSYIARREEMFDQLFEVQEKNKASSDNPSISILLPNGESVDGVAFETCPMDVAKGISKKLGKESVVAKVVYSNRFKF